MTIDVIILSYAKNNDIFEMNNRCIDSILNSTKNHNFNIFLIETESNIEYKYIQPEVTVIQPNTEFNYNKFLNIGFEYCKNEWILISNNDTVYHENFLEEMLRIYDTNKEIVSMSPMDDTWYRHQSFNKEVDVHYGYRVSYEIAGWSIFINKKIIESFGKFDEKFKFWYQDDDYSQMLQKYKFIHVLATKSKVTHLLNKSHNLINPNIRHEMTNGQIHTFKEKWK